MKAAVFEKTGPADVLKIVEIDKPSPGKGEVLLRYTSAGLNRADTLFRAGMYLQTPRLPSRSGMEGAGVVEAVGEGVERFKPGDRVAALPGMIDTSAQGACAEYGVLPERLLIPTPKSVSDQDAGAVWMQFLTAWGALAHVVNVKPGQVVVVTAASSSVGLAAVQIANDMGATTIATTTSADKVGAIRANGAAHVVDVKNEDYGKRVKEISAGKGADVVFDPVAGPMVAEHVKATRQGGTIFLYGVLDIRPIPLNPGLLLGKNINLRGYTLFPLVADPAALANAVAKISERLDDGRFRLNVDRRFPLAEVAEAHRYMESNRQIGKIVVNP